jgi:hypothetical protein
MTRKLIVVVAAALVATVTAGSAAAAPSKQSRQLRNVKAALDKYRSVAVAEADGYAAAGPCEMTPVAKEATWWGGAMGVHYVNNALLGKPIDPMKPPILTYLPQPNGRMRLLAAEYFKPDADQKLTTDGDRPSIFGQPFNGPMKGHAPGMPIHYDLHVWLWVHNPSGTFAPWNPNVGCK